MKQRMKDEEKKTEQTDNRKNKWACGRTDQHSRVGVGGTVRRESWTWSRSSLQLIKASPATADDAASASACYLLGDAYCAYAQSFELQ